MAIGFQVDDDDIGLTSNASENFLDNMKSEETTASHHENGTGDCFRIHGDYVTTYELFQRARSNITSPYTVWI